jgi:hypothetical protein
MSNKISLNPVPDYQADVHKFLQFHPTSKDITLKIEKRTNRHRSCDGNINTLKEFDIEAWNSEATKHPLSHF